MIIETILKINPNAIVNVIGNDIDNCKIEWLENTTPISKEDIKNMICLLYTSPSPRDGLLSRMPSSA